MTTCKPFFGLTILSLSALAASAGAANIVLNPGFETGDFTYWTATPQVSGTLSVSTEPHTGTYNGNSNGNSDTLAQILTTVPNEHYDFSFWLAQAPPATAIEGPFNGFTAYWDGSPIAASVMTNIGPLAYTQYTYSDRIATTASTEIKFVLSQVPVDTSGICGSQVPGVWGLDDVVVQVHSAGSGSGVPEPSSIALALAGLAGLVGLNLRKK